MTKAELVEKINEKVEGLTKGKAEEVFNAILDCLKEALTEKQDVVLTGFGTFKVVTRAARKGHNPQTREEIDIPERQVVKFNPAKALKEAVK